MQLCLAARATCFTVLVVLLASVYAAEKRYGPGVSDTEIKIGQTMPYSGPASVWATVGFAHAAFFEMINAQGGINGRKVRLISLDDAMTPSRTVEQVRKLVEQEEVLLTFGVMGPGNFAVQKYLNAKKVPHLFPSAPSVAFHDPKASPWTMGWMPTLYVEGKLYARYVLANRPDAKVAVLYLYDDLGKEYLRGIRDGFGGKADKIIVGVASYAQTDATIDSQIIQLQDSGANVLFSGGLPKFTTQAIRKVYELGWKPYHVINYAVNGVEETLKPAGLEKAVGLISANFAKDPFDPRFAEDREVKDFLSWMKTYLPRADIYDDAYQYGYMQANLMLAVLKQCGDDLTRDNVMRQAANLKNVRIPMLLDGILVNTSPTDYRPLKQFQLERFDGQRWVYFGPIITE